MGGRAHRRRMSVRRLADHASPDIAFEQVQRVEPMRRSWRPSCTKNEVDASSGQGNIDDAAQHPAAAVVMEIR